ncbi:MAG: carboxypeptidase-like regulatory domain-containing protein, partial [Candidatus Brocadia sp.]
EYISAVILKKDLKSLNMQFLDTKNYPDVIFLNVTNMAVECKIKEIAEDTIQVLIPTAAISSLKMFFQPGDKQVKTVPDEVESKPKTMDVVVKKEKMGQTEGRVPESKLEDGGESRIADEIRTSPTEKTSAGKYYRLKTKKKKVERAEVEGDLSKTETEGVTAGVDESVMGEKTQEPDTETSELKQKLASESQDKGSTDTAEEYLKKEKPVIQDPNLGSVEGRILHSGKPLPDCQVKLQMLEKGGLLSKGYRPVEGAVELEAVTDKDGIYHFMNVSPGLYKLYWKPPSETTWVRRFKMEPDVIVTSGKPTNPKDIETLKRTLN